MVTGSEFKWSFFFFLNIPLWIFQSSLSSSLFCQCMFHPFSIPNGWLFKKFPRPWIILFHFSIASLLSQIKTEIRIFFLVLQRSEHSLCCSALPSRGLIVKASRWSAVLTCAAARVLCSHCSRPRCSTTPAGGKRVTWSSPCLQRFSSSPASWSFPSGKDDDARNYHLCNESLLFFFHCSLCTHSSG